MLQLHNLEPLKKKRKRVGRGGSRGGTSGRGHKGQKSRSGSNKLKPFFEGGQMPLSRRLPRRGFTNIFKKEYIIIGLRDLERCFKDGDNVDVSAMRVKGLVKGKKGSLVKILVKGELTKKLTVHADKFSKSAAEMIEKVGGVAQQRVTQQRNVDS